MGGDLWFIDLDGNPVEPNSVPVAKIYVVDPNREMDREWILYVTEPDPWEKIVITNATTFEVLGDHSGAFDSRGDARKNGFSGPVFHGLELCGTRHRTFWVWCPTPLDKPPTMSRKRLFTAAWWEFLTTMGWVNKRLHKPSNESR
jgi:hypothetical protein